MARRPFDPAAHGWRKVAVPPGRRPGSRVGGGAVQRRRRRRAPRVHHRRGLARERAHQLGGVAQRLRVGRRGGRSAVGVRLVGGGLRLPGAGSPDRRGRSGRRQRAHAVLRITRRRSRRCSARCSRMPTSTPTSSGPASSPGPQAPMLVNQIPYVRWASKLPGAVRALFDVVPILKPVLPDPGVPFQLVHHDDVATALRAASWAAASPGPTTRRRRDDHDVGPRPRVRGITRCRCPTWRSTRPPRSSRGCR